MKTDSGRRLAGRYVLEDPIGRGGMAEVWRGRDEVLDRPVAVKILHEEIGEDGEVFERFRAEAMMAARLSHPGVVRVFDTGVERGLCYIVMELFEGETLSRLLEDRGPLPPHLAAEMTAGILEGLGHAHAHGIVHRDVKPGNILLHHGQAKLADFGIAKAAESDDLTRTGELLGTSRYLSPEQVEGGEVDARSDLYATGIVLYEMLTGRTPWASTAPLAEARARLTSAPPRPGSIRALIPPALEDIVLRALARDPDDRFESAEEMRAALERWAVESGASAAPPPIAEVHRAHSFFRAWMLVPTAIIAAAAVAVAVGVLVGRLELGGPLGVRAADDPDPAPAAATIQVAAVSAIDPEGDGAEHGSEAPLAVDGDGETAWGTEGYASPDLGGLKSGVGLLLELGDTRALSRIAIRTPNPGWTFQIRRWDGEALGDPLASTRGATTFASAAETIIELPRIETDAVVLWVTELAPAGDGRFRAIVSEVEVSGG